ncbi:filamentous hemagglutinin N-terminal domain-containing protein [Desmonostoc muscorum LEGE 12446]|uniref:two-partner secretion domain-containing protein n=1 Tax=Desmonostoc muscorum TaxID=1179 RepID=UPI001F2ED07D|nr:filamentous hemagglutinin N-terminal domain-containing protein [Desmonostoc muscorum]MCF2149780.1 filamentous hemagglutinin N-terminal domain-containing protein [Desmonostoc muscorum LEGE 12446]
MDCLRIIGILVAWSSLQAIAFAQIAPDGSLGGEQSQVAQGTVQEAPAKLIEGGARRGTNLFHSFSDFNVGNLERVYFNNPTGVENILSRVTGSNPSTILGTLGVNGNANLFLINANGIVFGANARLDIRGSFLIGTADSLKFDNGFGFSASNPLAPPLLTVNVPLGLQYGANPGSVRVQGVRQNALQVATGQTLALVGGDVLLEGGNLTAPGGRIELGSVAAGSLVSITPINPGWELGYQGVQQFQDIRLTQDARVNANGNSGGGIQLQGRRISILDGAQVFVMTQGSQAGKNITLRATELVEVISDPLTGKTSRVAAETSRGATGNAGNLTIETENLRVVDGAVISANTFGAGKGGDLTVRAKSIEVIGANALAFGTNPSSRIPSSLVTQVNQNATGNAGNLTIETESLRVSDGGLISVGTFEVGNGGNLTIRAKSIEVIGFNQGARFISSLSAQTFARAIGNAGDIIIVTDRLNIANRGEIRTTSEGSGRAGNMTMQANSQITLADEGRIIANTNTLQGNITLTTPLLLMRRGGSITTNAAGTGTGGNINIDAGFIVSAPNENNDIIANAFGGSGGKIAISAQSIFEFNLRTREDLQRLLNTTNPLGLDPRLLASNDITAFSQANPAIDTGIITLQTSNLDPTRGLTTLPTDFTDISQLIATTCPADRGSSFTITGRGGIPEDPRQPLMGEVIWQDERVVREHGGAKAVEEVPGVAIAEAQGWIVDRSGAVVLVAQQPQKSLGLTYPVCATSNTNS